MLGKELTVPSTQSLEELRRSLYVSEEKGEGSRGETRCVHRSILSIARPCIFNARQPRRRRRDHRDGCWLTEDGMRSSPPTGVGLPASALRSGANLDVVSSAGRSP